MHGHPREPMLAEESRRLQATVTSMTMRFFGPDRLGNNSFPFVLIVGKFLIRSSWCAKV